MSLSASLRDEIVNEVQRLVTPIPERRSLEILSTFIAGVLHSFEEIVSEDVAPGVINSVARLIAREFWEQLGEPKTVEELLEAVSVHFPAHFERYDDVHFIVRECPIRDISERENIRYGGPLCLFARGFLWYFLTKIAGLRARVNIVKPGYYACLCSLKGTKFSREIRPPNHSYEEYLEKSHQFLIITLKGIINALVNVLGDVAKSYLYYAGYQAGLAHSTILPTLDSPFDAIEVLNAFMVIWSGEVKEEDDKYVVYENKYELGYPKDPYFCTLFYSYLSGIFSGILDKSIILTPLDCSTKKVIKVE